MMAPRHEIGDLASDRQSCGPNSEEVVNQPGGEKDADRHQVADLLLAKCDGQTSQPTERLTTRSAAHAFAWPRRR